MMRFLVMAAAIGFMYSTSLVADDYRLRIESFESRRSSDEPPETSAEKAVDTIEVVTRPGEAFNTKVTMGSKTLTMSGKLTADTDGGFVVQVRHICEVDTGEAVLIAPNKRQPILARQAVSIQRLVATPGKPLTLGGMDSTQSEGGKPEITVRRRIVLTLTKEEASDDEN